MNIPLNYIIISIIILLFALKVILAKHPTIKKYNLIISFLLFLLIAIILAVEFWKNNIHIGVVAVLLGFIAFSKILYDRR